MSIINYIELSNGSTTWRIAASLKNSPSNALSDVIVTSVDGILSPGELSEDPVARSYSDGSVWNPNATRAGKNIIIPIVFYSEDSLSEQWSDFHNFFYSSGLITLVTHGGFNRTYRCQPQTLEVDDEFTGAISCTLIMTSREAH